MGFEAPALSKSLPREGRSGIFAKALEDRKMKTATRRTLYNNKGAQVVVGTMNGWMDEWWWHYILHDWIGLGGEKKFYTYGSEAGKEMECKLLEVVKGEEEERKKERHVECPSNRTREIKPA